MFHSPYVIGCWGPMFTQNSAISAASRLQFPAADILAFRLLGEVLSQRMIKEVLREEDPFQIRVPLVDDSHQVPLLPFVVERRVPRLHDAVDLRIVAAAECVDLDRRV